MLSVQANTGPHWSNKSEIAFWRGRDSRQERLDLVRMSLRHPDKIDARLTRMFFFKHSPDLGDLVEHISFFDFFKVLAPIVLVLEADLTQAVLGRSTCNFVYD